jgi:hypothetical protein
MIVGTCPQERNGGIQVFIFCSHAGEHTLEVRLREGWWKIQGAPQAHIFWYWRKERL